MAQSLEQPPDGMPGPTPQPTMAIALGDGQFGIEAVGTAEHQDELELVAGPRSEAGVDHLCGALLVPDPKNPYDANAIAVVIASRVIGYVPSNIAPSLKYAMRVGGFIAAGCAAKIVGGWARADGDIGDFGVRLDAEWPFKLRSIAKQTAPNPPPPLVAAAQSAIPVAARSAIPVAPQVQPQPFDDDAPPLVAEPRRRRSLIVIGVELLFVAAILAGGYWWLQRLPREPAEVAAPAPAAPAPSPEPAPAPAEPAPPEPQPFTWPDPPPQFQPPAATPPPAAPAEPSAPAPRPKKKAPAKAKPAAPKEGAPGAPLKIN